MISYNNYKSKEKNTMGRMELEVKVLNIDEEKVIKSIKNNGGKLIEVSKQILYTYDLQSLYGRYLDILLLINDYYDKKIENKLAAQIERLKLLFFEIDNLLYNNKKNEVINIIGYSNFTELLSLEISKLIEFLNKEEVKEFLSQFHNNDKKWIRLRQTNDKVTLTVKHILADNESNIQQMLETEMKVPSIEEANNLLEALGFAFKSFQEKTRKTYAISGYEIDIDTWPMLNTYMEIEGKDKQDLEKILNILGYKWEDTISCTVDEIYKQNGIDSLSMREIKF